MSYEKKKKELEGIREKKRKAKIELSELEVKYKRLLEEFGKSGERLTDARAALKVGDGSQKKVDSLKDENSRLKDELGDIKDQIAIQNKVLSLYDGKIKKASDAFNGIARTYHEDRLEPHFDKLIQALKMTQSAIDTINEVQREARKDKVSLGLAGINENTKVWLNKASVPGMSYRYLVPASKFIADTEKEKALATSN